MDIYQWVVIGAWAAFIVVWFSSAITTKRTKTNVWRYLGWRVVALIVLLVIIAKDPHAWIAQYHPALFVDPTLGSIGSALAVLGIAFAMWARFYLGRNWGMPMSVKENPVLVTSGPYAYVRHPIYTGVILAMIGTGLVVGAVWLAFALAAFVYFFYSARKEEGLMLETFPNEYPAYKARTKMLVPFIF